MAILKPTVGSFRVEGATMADVVDITLNVTINTGETTPVGVSWAQVIELHKSWTASVSCNYNPTDTAQAAAVTGYTTGDATFTTLSFYEDASTNYAGSALLTGATVTKSVGSPDKLSLTYMGNAALART